MPKSIDKLWGVYATLEVQQTNWREVVGLKDKLFGSKRELKQRMELPAILQPENPVNYNSVLDYMIGLSDKDYKKLTASAEVYRKANREVAKIVGIKDEPTHTLMTEKPSDEQIEQDLDNMLNEPDLATAFLEDDVPVDTITKPQAPKKPKQAEAKE